MTSTADAICFIGSARRRSSVPRTAGFSRCAQDAALAAIEDAGLTRDDIDGYVGAPLATGAGSVHADGGDEVTARTLVESLGMIARCLHERQLQGLLRPTWQSRRRTLFAAGACRYVLGVRALYNLPEVDYATAAPTLAFGLDQFRTPFGARRGRGPVRDARHRLSASNRCHPARSLRGRRALSPACRAQSAWRSGASARCNAGAVSRCSDDRVTAWPLRLRHAGVRRRRLRHDARRGPPPQQRTAGLPRRGRRAGSASADIFANAGRTRADIDPCADLRRLLLHGVRMARAARLLRAGSRPGSSFARVTPTATAALPLNTFGGSLGEGRLHGIGHLREAILQVSGRAGPRQLRNEPRTASCRSAPSISPRSSSSARARDDAREIDHDRRAYLSIPYRVEAFTYEAAPGPLAAPRELSGTA